MIYIDKINIIKKYSKYDPLVLNFDELKINPHSYLTKISKYTNSNYNKIESSQNKITYTIDWWEAGRSNRHETKRGCRNNKFRK